MNYALKIKQFSQSSREYFNKFFLTLQLVQVSS